MSVLNARMYSRARASRDGVMFLPGEPTGGD
jgi:hypothetical protein